MALPLWMLRGLKIRLSQKLGLIAIFSIAIVIVAFDILRTVKSIDGGAFSESALYGILEMTIAVMISCLPTYRTLFGIESKRKRDMYVDMNYKPSEGSQNSEGHPLRDGEGSNTSVERGEQPTTEVKSTSRGIYESYPTGSMDHGTSEVVPNSMFAKPQQAHVKSGVA